MAEGKAFDRRLAIFVPTLQYGGVERVMLNLAAGFAQRGFKVDLVAADARGHLRKNVPERVRVFDLTSSRVLTSLPGLVKYLRRRRPATLIAAMDHSSVMALWARKLAGVQTRIIATVHANVSGVLNHSSRLRVRLLPLFMRYFYPWADEIVAVSNGVANDLAVRAHLPRDRVKVIYNPTLNGRFFEKAEEPVRHSWFSPDQPPVILGVGRLVIEKGFDVLIQAFARVRQQRPAKLMILGEGDQRPVLEALSRELGVDEDVCLAGYQENPYAYMARANVFVLSSRYEGFCLALVEALALGLPIVSTDCESGPREVLRDGQYGALVPVGSVESLAAATLSNLDRGKQSAPRDWLKNFEESTALDSYQKLIDRQRQTDTHSIPESEASDFQSQICQSEASRHVVE
jgi:glycosyltransferase involved in cell wall biosynthesis